MKNRLSYLLLIAVLGFLAAPRIQATSLGGGIIVPIAGKTSNAIESIVIPSKYVTTEGNFLLPVEIVLTNDCKYSTSFTLKQGADYIQLPTNLTGEYLLQISVGDFYVEMKLVL